MAIADRLTQRADALLKRLDNLPEDRARWVGAAVGAGVMGAALWVDGPAPWLAGFGVGVAGVQMMLSGSAQVVTPPLAEPDWLPAWWGAATRPVRIGAVPPPDALRAAVRPVMVWIPGGELWVGSPDDDPDANDRERPRLRFRVPGLAVAATPVTRRQWAAVMGKEQGDGPIDGPVNRVTWFDAARFCNRLSELEGLRPVYRVTEQKRAEVDPLADGYRLPTEAEWEFMARAGTETRWSFGADEAKLKDYAWFDENGGQTTHPVSEKLANPWSLFDVHGNVLEWCGNEPRPYNSAVTTVGDPFVVEMVVNTSTRAVRGGSAWNASGDLRSACRGGLHPWGTGLGLGFRCVRVPSRQPGPGSVVP